MDFVAFVNHLPAEGETLAAEQFQMVSGGKAANQAVAASRLGSQVAMVGRVGDDELGKKLKAHLVQDSVDDRYVRITEGAQTGISMIAVAAGGHNTFVTWRGANAHLGRKDVDETEELLEQAKFAIVQMARERSVGEYIISKVHQKGVKLVLNRIPVVEVGQHLLRMIDLLVVNETEAAQLTGMEGMSLRDAERAAGALCAMGSKNVVITLGEHGALLKTPAGVAHYSAPRVEVVDGTAAGDCFVGATTHFWSQTGDLGAAVQAAVEVAALSITKKGAQTSLPSMEEYLEFVKSKG
jgi:ribokinase